MKNEDSFENFTHCQKRRSVFFFAPTFSKEEKRCLFKTRWFAGFEKLPVRISWWEGGFASWCVHLSFTWLICGLIRPKNSVNSTRFLGCVRQRPPCPRVECGNALPCGCHAMDLPVGIFCLLVLQGYVNPWPPWVAVSRRFHNAAQESLQCLFQDCEKRV